MLERKKKMLRVEGDFFILYFLAIESKTKTKYCWKSSGRMGTLVKEKAKVGNS